jgi:oligoribonuclease NrnB/cAMP/cGMP phosphodiesterase (DHH superfamily)
MKDCNELASETMYLSIGGYENIPTVNVNYTYGSDTASILCKGQPFAAYFWMNKDGVLVFGLRSDNNDPQAADVAKIAKSYGGGGHKNASGFRIANLNDL